jgi:hypothetical protein
MLRSSIIGKEFVNYRKTTIKHKRLQFSNSVRKEGIGNVPIVIDSVDPNITEALSARENRMMTYGKEMIFHMDRKVKDVVRDVKIILIANDREDIARMGVRLGLEDGTVLENDQELGEVYKRHKNEDDKILYLLVTKEETVYDYIMSILRHLWSNWFGSVSNASQMKGLSIFKKNH